MVKGVSRRVIVIKAPDPKLFEQAIFIVREDALTQTGADADEIVRQAEAAAELYFSSAKGGLLRRLPPFAFAALGAAVTAAVWIASVLLL